MHADEVPQEGLEYKGRDKVKKVMYAVDKNGQYTNVNSIGWEAENVAMREAWQEVEDNLAEVAAAVKAGKLSPLAWYMHKHLMDVGLLAKYAGKWKWTVNRHMKPEIFKKLSNATLEKYAGIFKVTVEELKDFKG